MEIFESRGGRNIPAVGFWNWNAEGQHNAYRQSWEILVGQKADAKIGDYEDDDEAGEEDPFQVGG
jgi:hypothetical protein